MNKQIPVKMNKQKTVLVKDGRHTYLARPTLESSDYLVTDDGRIWSDRFHKFIKPYTTGKKYPYLVVTLRQDRIGLQRLVARLVAQAWCPNPNTKKLTVVGYKDFDKSNTHPSNLFWANSTQNIRRAYKAGRMFRKSADV